MTTTIETGRALATVETIGEIAPIPGADAIVRARVRGWDVVVRIGEFEAGDRCVYFEIDSLLDVEDPRFAFLAPRGVQAQADGRSGHVLKTARLRGQYSQGLALPVDLFPELDSAAVGDDVTARLGIVRWEQPTPDELAGAVRGPMPEWIPTTSEVRIQNVAGLLAVDADWRATEKADGVSVSVYVDPEASVRGVCSREWDYLDVDGNPLWALARQYQVHDLIAETWPGQRAAVQGEMIGEGIRRNPLRLKGKHLRLFTVRVDRHELPRGQWPAWAVDLSVPVLDLPFPRTVEEALAGVEGLTSALAARPAEGVVWRAADRELATLSDGSMSRASFKVISNRYLLKNDR
ncbi:RNA ligase (ATP) [Frankia sp. AgW1.1]|uniref:RNA ligase (ATP) n=1 Tax=Frankia sp. AgW1.1 TaxID=1836971 RepID=UPI001932B7D7|nr:RNA ligase (ATP) [Frankia sp. AgW1.1]MBL7487046.1 RNA ligase (ATP) [Frankia sp. AgW1.1]